MHFLPILDVEVLVDGLELQLAFYVFVEDSLNLLVIELGADLLALELPGRLVNSDGVVVHHSLFGVAQGFKGLLNRDKLIMASILHVGMGSFYSLDVIIADFPEAGGFADAQHLVEIDRSVVSDCFYEASHHI